MQILGLGRAFKPIIRRFKLLDFRVRFRVSGIYLEPLQLPSNVLQTPAMKGHRDSFKGPLGGPGRAIGISDFWVCTAGGCAKSGRTRRPWDGSYKRKKVNKTAM